MPSQTKLQIALATMLFATICQGSLMAAGNGPSIRDTELGERGEFRGQVVTESGVPLGDVQVAILSANSSDTNAIAATKSDADGFFTLSGLRPGIYRLQAGQSVAIYRVWNYRTAPPAANQAALVVAERPVVAEPPTVRGQFGFGAAFGSLGSVGTVASQIGIVTAGAVVGMEIHDAMNDAS